VGAGGGVAAPPPPPPPASRFGYETSVISGAKTDFGHEYPLSDVQTGLLVSGNPAGATVGAAIAGVLQDRFGRRVTLIFACAAYIGAVMVSFTAHGFAQLAVGRLLTGLTIGVFSSTVPMYIAGEPCAAAHRNPPALVPRPRATWLAAAVCGTPHLPAVGDDCVMWLRGMQCTAASAECCLHHNAAAPHSSPARIDPPSAACRSLCRCHTPPPPGSSAELSPGALRGTLLTINQTCICVGILLGFCSNMLLSPHWQWELFCGAPLAGLLLLLFLLVTPYRWVWVQGGGGSLLCPRAAPPACAHAALAG
jgi:MFS family permease